MWARAAAGYNPTALSVKAGLAKGHVAMIESRVRVAITNKTAKALADVLGIPWAWLAEGDGDPPTEAQIKRAVAGAA